jgi:hypothetical protein
MSDGGSDRSMIIQRYRTRVVPCSCQPAAHSRVDVHIIMKGQRQCVNTACIGPTSAMAIFVHTESQANICASTHLVARNDVQKQATQRAAPVIISRAVLWSPHPPGTARRGRANNTCEEAHLSCALTTQPWLSTSPPGCNPAHGRTSLQSSLARPRHRVNTLLCFCHGWRIIV